MKPVKRFLLFTAILLAAMVSCLYLLYSYSMQLAKLAQKESSSPVVKSQGWSKKKTVQGISGNASRQTSPVTREFLSAKQSEFPSNGQKIILIGLDGATFDVINALIQQGELPFLSSIINGGTHGILLSIRPIKSPAIWTTIATGKTRYRHGIRDFVTQSADGRKMVPVTRYQRKTKALWNMLDDFGRQSVTINWWATTPPEQVNGCMVSDVFEFAFEPADQSKPLRLVCYPSRAVELLTNLDEGLDSETEKTFATMLQHRGNPHPMDGSNDRKSIAQLREFIRSDLLVYHAAERLLNEFPFDLAAIYFQGIDVISHHFWNRRNAGNRIPGGSVVAEYYKFTDGLLQSLAQKAGSHSNWVIVSDHGFQANPNKDVKTYDINKLFEQLGVLAFHEDSGEIDFGKTLVYDRQKNNLWDSVRFCYLNDGPGGVVGTGQGMHDPVKTIDRTWAVCSGLVTDSGTNLFLSISKPGSDASESAGDRPDMVFRFNPAVLESEKIVMGDRLIPLAEFITVDKVLPGSHDIRGIFCAQGPAFRSGAKISGISVLDILPTLIRVLGMPVAEDFDGKYIADSISGSIVIQSSNSIPTYETESRLQVRQTGQIPFQNNVIEQLKGIGYLE